MDTKESLGSLSNFQTLLCLLSVLLVLCCAGTVSLVAVACGQQPWVVTCPFRHSPHPAAEDGSLSLDMAMRGVIAFIVVATMGITITICVWYNYAKRINRRQQTATAAVGEQGVIFCDITNSPKQLLIET